MTQGLVAGMTDYSHQSFQDILDDLDNYLQLVGKTVQFIEDSSSKIENYWENSVPSNFKSMVAYSLRFYKMAESEIEEIFNEIQLEVKDTHHKRLSKMGDTAFEINNDIGKIWHSGSWYQDYGTPDFFIVEKIYIEIRDVAATLLDISNLASRLKDFVGKSNSKNKSALNKRLFEYEFISESRIEELKAIQTTSFDLCRLIKLSEEINSASKSGNFLTVAVLTRALIDHIPPIFGVNSFNEIANNYKSTKSFKDSANNLNSSTRKIADSFLHTHIRSKESLPNFVQINCSQDLDVLLAEIYRILK